LASGSRESLWPLPSRAEPAKSRKNYELQFESDGSPMILRKIRQAPLVAEKRRAKQVEQRECCHKAAAPSRQGAAARGDEFILEMTTCD
jgi:hypothetical protein